MHQFGDPGSKCQDLCTWKKSHFVELSCILEFVGRNQFSYTVNIYSWLKKQITDSLLLKVVFTQRVEYKL